MTKYECEKMAIVQTLIGRGMGSYQNDRDPNRAEHVMGPLRQAFDICVQLRKQCPPD